MSEDSSDRDYEVGYRRPPRHRRFKKGESGNRRGRPKGVKNTSSIVDEVLSAKLEYRENGKVRMASGRKIILLRTFEKATKGDLKAAEFLLRLDPRAGRAALEAAAADTLHAAALEAEDRKFLVEFRKELGLASLPSDKDVGESE